MKMHFSFHALQLAKFKTRVIPDFLIPDLIGKEFYMDSITEVLMRRDGLSEEDARREVADFKENIQESIINGDLDDIEEALMNDLGLEPDYLMDILF